MKIRKGEPVTVQEVIDEQDVAERTARGVLEVAAREAALFDVVVDKDNKRLYRPKVKMEALNTIK